MPGLILDIEDNKLIMPGLIPDDEDSKNQPALIADVEDESIANIFCV
jgi:hypothetical protein